MLRAALERKMVAFASGQHARLGVRSWVRVVDMNILGMVWVELVGSLKPAL